MKTRTLITVAAVAIIAMWGTTAVAFHDGGVAHCNGCHTMHNSQDGVAMNDDGTGAAGTPVGTGFTDLLLFGNKNDVCLTCHAGDGGYHVWATDPLVPGPEHGGGNFVFLEEDNINDGHAGATNPILGEKSGHSLASNITGTTTDSVLTLSPGGAYPAADLHCTSCHDPHGNSSFRLLYRTNQQHVSDTGVVINWAAEIDADGVGFFGPGAVESDTNHNAYRTGYSDWCASCHGDFHQGSAVLIHPSGEVFETRQIQVYNAYRGTTDCVNNPPVGGNPCGTGTSVDSYLHMVPFEDDAATMAKVDGPSVTSRVACMSCHRAHASSSPDAGRWDFNVTLLVEDGLESGSYPMPNPYDANQRSLCNKCHSQDEFDHITP